jgi:hypothetical protein
MILNILFFFADKLLKGGSLSIHIQTRLRGCFFSSLLALVVNIRISSYHITAINLTRSAVSSKTKQS